VSTTLTRGPLTELLLVTLAGLGKPVGDGVVPTKDAGAGWSGPPNAPGSQFTPFTVLITLSAGLSSGPFFDSQADWTVPFMLEAFGVSREQCEWMADAARSALAALTHQVITLGADHYKVQQVKTDSIGGVNRVMVTDPPFFGQQDGLSVWITKERS
jgi:hypothetical protein